MRSRREVCGRRWVRVCVFFAFPWARFVELGLGVEMMLGMSTLSSWKSERLASSSREKCTADSSPERMGRMKRGQSCEATCWKERRSRPECLERES